MESFALKSFSFGALSPSAIITRCKNTLKSISHRNLAICASSASSSGSVVTLLDYGAGIVGSVKNAICYLGFEIKEIFDKKENEVRNLGKPVELGGQYFKNGADEVSFLNITGFRDFPLGNLPMLQVLKHTSENVFGAFASAMDVLTKTRLGRVCQEGKVVSIGRKMKEKIKGYVSSLISFDKSRMHEFAEEAEASNTKPITKQEENRGWFKVCLMVFLLLPNGLRCVRSEDMGNALIHGSTAMNSLLANKNLRGFEPSGRRQMVSFNYNNFPRGNSGTSNPPFKPANPYQRPCNAAEYCRQGNKERTRCPE